MTQTDTQEGMMRNLVIGLMVALFGLSGCSKNVATCWTQGDGSSVHASFGYFYDSAEVTVSGPSTFKRIPEKFQGDPCGGLPQP